MTTYEEYFEQLYTGIVNDPRVDSETLFTSRTGIVITAVSASLSIIGSGTIIFVIKQSSDKLESVYHRILLMMSIFDIIQSLAMALTTLPMPSDMIYHQYQGISIGNNLTCNLQGFFVGVGTIGSLLYNAILSLYYLSVIFDDMDDKRFRQRIEPGLHIISILVNLSLNVPSLVYRLFNPQPLSTVWCSYGRLPWWCDVRTGGCLAPKPRVARAAGRMKKVYAVSMPFILAIIIISFLFIVVKVERLKRTGLGTLREDSDDSDGSNENDSPRQGDNVPRRSRRIQDRIVKEARFLKKQALAYSLINILGFTTSIIIPMVRTFDPSGTRTTDSLVLQCSYVILRPLQGLFNFCIFIFHKARSLQQVDNTLTLRRAIVMATMGSEPQESAVLDLELVREYDAIADLNLARNANMNTSIDGGGMRMIANVINAAASQNENNSSGGNRPDYESTCDQDLSGFSVVESEGDDIENENDDADASSSD